MAIRFSYGLMALLAAFLLLGSGMLLFSGISNQGFGAGFIAAAIVVFLSRVMQIRRDERESNQDEGMVFIVASRAAYSSLALFGVLASLTVIGTGIAGYNPQVGVFSALGAFTGIYFVVYIALFAVFQYSIDEE